MGRNVLPMVQILSNLTNISYLRTKRPKFHRLSLRVCSVATPESIWRSNLNLTRSFGDSDDFSIWSSSRSVIASNLHALPYEVVVLELLAPEYSKALTSTSRFRISLELYATTPLLNMATPPAYTILIQHLYVIYDVLLTFVIRVFLRTRGEPGVIRVTG